MNTRKILASLGSNQIIKYLSNINGRNVSLVIRPYSSREPQNQPDTESEKFSVDEKKLSHEIIKLNDEIKDLTEKNNEIIDKYKRSLADNDNMRKRLTKQIEDAKIFGIQSFCKDLLEVADILGHATKSVPEEQLKNGKNPDLKNLFEGITMTQSSLNQVFKRNGLELVDPLNQKFDPNFHEAIFINEAPNVEPNTVIVVSKVGYKLRDRCIRPALVGVSNS